MFLKCPKCQERKVLEVELADLTWKRACHECGFVYTLAAIETGWEPPYPELVEEQLELAV